MFAHYGGIVNMLIFDFDVEIAMVEILVKQLTNARVHINGDKETICIMFENWD
jgi:hypothetical protein